VTSLATLRGSALLLALCALWYLPWLVSHGNPDAPLFAVAFIAANLLLVACAALTAFNNWTRSTPAEMLTRPGTEPLVATILTTAGEDVEQVRRTARSVLDQDWPLERQWLLVSDDGRSDAMAAMAAEIETAFPLARVSYHRPPPRGAQERRGDAKAGNLNSALALVRTDPAVAFIETRDADDEVGDREFLSRCVAQLRADARVAYVQTIKEARVSHGDPFDNLQPHFFRGVMHARNAANAVFPCGSGLLWREAALADIGGFPAWNLVEDLQSGVEALRRGWRGLYLPIVGAVGQHAPEDIPNVYKQRGTWALDTVRLLVWGDLRGLSLRQRLQFAELGLFYAQSAATVLFVLAPVLGLVAGVYPLRTDMLSYLLHFWPFAVALELQLALLNRPNRYESLWTARQLWVGLAPVYLKATVLAVLGGRHRKPRYRVTRKHDEFAWYWRATLPQAMALVALVAALLHGAASSRLSELDLGSAYWAALYVLLLAGFLRKSWHGVAPLARLRPVARALPRLAPVAASLGAGALVLAGLVAGGGASPAPTVALGLAGTASALAGALVRGSSAGAALSLLAAAVFVIGAATLVGG